MAIDGDGVLHLTFADVTDKGSPGVRGNVKYARGILGSRLSASASQDASIMSVEEPTVVQLCSPSVDSIRTRTLAPVPAAESMMRTL